MNIRRQLKYALAGMALAVSAPSSATGIVIVDATLWSSACKSQEQVPGGPSLDIPVLPYLQRWLCALMP